MSESNGKSVVGYALNYAERGIRVFPCNGKLPTTAQGFKDATTAKDQILEWWAERPEANIAAPTGNGIVVIDLDGDDALGSLGEREAEWGPLPQTATVKTGRGTHRWFRVPPGAEIPNSAGKIGPGIDVRGDGGYVVMPPSLHGETGQRYAWLRDEGGAGFGIADLPDAWVNQLRKREREPRAVVEPAPFTGAGSKYGMAALDAECEKVRTAPEGQRNHSLNEAAFSLGQLEAGGELCPGVAEPALIAAAQAAGLGLGEAERTVRSGLEAGQGEPRRAPEDTRLRPMSNGVAPVVVQDGEVAELPVLRTLLVEKVVARSIEWHDKPFLQRSAFHLVAGPKGVGKGTWLSRVAANVTRGVYGDPQSVLLISSEDSPSIDIRPRLEAAGADMSRVWIVDESFTLPDDLKRLRGTALDLGNIGLIVVDPVGNHLGSADTDKESSVRNALSGLNQLADDLSCVVIGVRHIAKNRSNGALASVLGSTAWVDLPRAVLMFAHDDEDPMVFHVQVVAGNRSGRGSAGAFRIELADVGLKEPVTKCVELGESGKDVDDLLATPRRTSNSAAARDLILTILENEGDQESDTLDARVARETGLSAKTVKNQRSELKNAGLVRNVPEKDGFGQVERWLVTRTAAPRDPA